MWPTGHRLLGRELLLALGEVLEFGFGWQIGRSPLRRGHGPRAGFRRRLLEVINLLCSISSQTSEDPGAGHFYWHYRALALKGDSGCLLGPKSLLGLGEDALLNASAVSDRFSPNLLSPWRYPFGGLKKAVSRKLQAGFNTFQFYEGSLVDLVCVIFLAPRFPQGVFIFNFFWTREWVHLWRKRPLLWTLIDSCLARVSKNIVLMGDTELFAKQVMERSKMRVTPYPNFSPFDFPPNRSQRKRPTDVVVMCKREFELDFALETLSLLDAGTCLTISFFLPAGLSCVSKFEAVKKRHSIMVFSDTLQEESYVTLLAGSKVVFLSYLKDHYLYGSSGKLADLALAGCRTLVPAESGLASQGRKAPQGMLAKFNPTDPSDAARGLKKLLLLRGESTPWGRDVSGFLTQISALGERPGPAPKLSNGRVSDALSMRLWAIVLIASAGYRGIPRRFYSYGLGLKLARVAVISKRMALTIGRKSA